MVRAAPVDASTIILIILALLFTALAYMKDPGLPAIGARNGLAALVAYMTSWSLFGIQRIIAWEAPLMGWHFVVVRVVPSLAFPLLAGWLVQLFYQE